MRNNKSHQTKKKIKWHKEKNCNIIYLIWWYKWYKWVIKMWCLCNVIVNLYVPTFLRNHYGRVMRLSAVHLDWVTPDVVTIRVTSNSSRLQLSIFCMPRPILRWGLGIRLLTSRRIVLTQTFTTILFKKTSDHNMESSPNHSEICRQPVSHFQIRISWFSKAHCSVHRSWN